MPTVDDIPHWQVPAWLAPDQRRLPLPENQPYCWSLAQRQTHGSRGRVIWLWVAVDGEWIVEPVSLRAVMPATFPIVSEDRDDARVEWEIDRAIAWLREGNAPATPVHPFEYMESEDEEENETETEDEEEERSEARAARAREAQQYVVGRAFSGGTPRAMYCSVHGRVDIAQSFTLHIPGYADETYCGRCVTDGLRRLGVQTLSDTQSGATYVEPRKYEVKKRKIRTRREK